MIGHKPSSGLGMNTSIGQCSTQVLHPLQISGLKIAGLPGVATLGRAYSVIVSPLLHRAAFLIPLMQAGGLHNVQLSEIENADFQSRM